MMKEKGFEIKCLKCGSLNTEIKAITINALIYCIATEIEILCKECEQSTNILYEKL